MLSSSVQPRIFIKGHGFFTFNKICKNIGKNLSGKNSQKLLDHSKQCATDTSKTALKRAI